MKFEITEKSKIPVIWLGNGGRWIFNTAIDPDRFKYVTFIRKHSTSVKLKIGKGTKTVTMVEPVSFTVPVTLEGCPRGFKKTHMTAVSFGFLKKLFEKTMDQNGVISRAKLPLIAKAIDELNEEE